MRLLLLCVALAGCASASTGTVVQSAPERAPLPVAGRVTDTLLILGFDLSAVSTQVGGNYAGLAKVYQGPLYVTAEELRSWAQFMANLTSSTLQTTGYRVRQGSTTFSQVESYKGVRFALAGKISNLSANYYGVFAGNQTKAAMTVTWEVFDVAVRRVVHTAVTSGSSTTSGRSSDAVAVAFRVALSELLADGRFVEALIPQQVAEERAQPVAAAPEDPPPSRAPVSWRRSIPRESEMLQISAGDFLQSSGSPLRRATDAVVALRGLDGHGTAFLLTRDGLALTNFHVVRGSTRMRARTSRGLDLPVRIVRTDSATDLALVEIACASDCFTSDLSLTQVPDIGTEVFAIGTPLSETLSHSVTKGIVSGLRRRGGVSLVQTDAAVNPGNSGGPLIEAATGRVAAIVTLKLVAEDIEGVAFGIALPDALRVLGVVVR